MRNMKGIALAVGLVILIAVAFFALYDREGMSVDGVATEQVE